MTAIPPLKLGLTKIYDACHVSATQQSTKMQNALTAHEVVLQKLVDARRRLKYPDDLKYSKVPMPSKEDMASAQNGFLDAYDEFLGDVCKIQLMARAAMPAGIVTLELTEYEARMKSIDPQKLSALQESRAKYEKQLQALLALETKMKAVFDKFKNNLDEYCKIVANDGKPFGYVGLGVNKLYSYNIPLPKKKEERQEGKEDGKAGGGKASTADGAPASQKPLEARPIPPAKGLLDTVLGLLSSN